MRTQRPLEKPPDNRRSLLLMRVRSGSGTVIPADALAEDDSSTLLAEDDGVTLLAKD